jgi:hypothetical protein
MCPIVVAVQQCTAVVSESIAALAGADCRLRLSPWKAGIPRTDKTTAPIKRLHPSATAVAPSRARRRLLRCATAGEAGDPLVL